MKPTSQIPAHLQPNEFDRHTIDRKSSSPLTDYNLQATSPLHSEPGALANKPLPGPSIWRVSHEFFRAEAHRHFAAEAIFFALIVLIAAWPLLSLLEILAGPIR